jgi:dolichyl-phosphate beta-glucosyltransferase
MAVGFIFIRNFLIGLKNIKDTQCGFKAFNTEKANKIIESLVVFKKTHTVKGSSVSAGFDLEFLFLATKFGHTITEIPVDWKHVETKNVNFITDSLETLIDIVEIKYYDLTGAYKK